MTVRLYDLAHARAGDKGHIVNISVIAYDEAAYRHIEVHLTEECVSRHFAPVARGPVRRFILPKLRAFNFVIEHALGGGLSHDLHGKSLSSFMLTICLPDVAMNAP